MIDRNNFNIILSSMARYPNMQLLFRFSYQNFVCIPHLHMRATRPGHPVLPPSPGILMM